MSVSEHLLGGHLCLEVSPDEVPAASISDSVGKPPCKPDHLVVHEALILGTFNKQSRLDQQELHKLNKLLQQLAGWGITHVVLSVSFDVVRLKKALDTFPVSAQLRITIYKCPDDLSGLMKAQLHLKGSFLLLVPSHLRAGQGLCLENLLDQIEDNVDFSVKNIIALVDQPPQEAQGHVITTDKLGGVFVCSSVFVATLRRFFKYPQVHSFNDIAAILLRTSGMAYLYVEEEDIPTTSSNNNEEDEYDQQRDGKEPAWSTPSPMKPNDLVLHLDERKQAFKDMLVNTRKGSVRSVTKKRACIVPIEYPPTPEQQHCHDDNIPFSTANESTSLLGNTQTPAAPRRGSALHWFPAPFSNGVGYPKVRNLSQAEGEQHIDGMDSVVDKMSAQVKRLSLRAISTSKESIEVLQQALLQQKQVPIAAYVLLCTSLVSVSSQGAVLDMLGPVPPMLKLFWRMSGASLAFFPFALHWVLKHFGSVGGFWNSLPEKSVVKFLAGATAYSILTGTFFFALRETSISHVYLFSNCHSILLVLSRFIFQSGNLLRLEIIGTLVGFTGIFITSHATSSPAKTSTASATDSMVVEATFSGDMLAFTGAFAGVCYLLIVKEIRHQINVWVFLFSLMTFVWVALLPIMYFTIPQLSISTDPDFGLFGWVNFVGIELYLVFVVTFLGTMGRVRCLRYFDPLIVSCTMLLEPIVASWIGIMLGFDTWPGIATLVGGLNVLCGCFLVLIASHLSNATPGVAVPTTTSPPTTRRAFMGDPQSSTTPPTTKVSAYGSMEL